MGGSVVSRPSSALPLLPRGDRERLNAILARLDRMTSDERIRASRYSFNAWERQVWAGHFPEEVPLINGEVEWIALRSADLDK
jgi:hypothetical protein